MMIWRNVRNVGNRVLTADPRGAQHATGTLQRANEGLSRGSRVLNAIGRRVRAPPFSKRVSPGHVWMPRASCV